YLPDGSDSRTWYDHVYVQTDEKKNGVITESNGDGGVTIRNNEYRKKTKFYLRLRLPDDRLIS
ncbi:MAG TPA: hypothetical protein PK341_18500, partial [Spirochaetota bacterium]|nr:hypothetical protein [Spirochaetota bacterium]